VECGLSTAQGFSRPVALWALRVLGADLASDATSVDVTAESIPLDDGAVGAAFVAEAYHWFDTHQATRELAHVLEPGAALLVLFTVWNGSFQPGPSIGALEAIQAVADRTGPTGGPKWMAGDWQDGRQSTQIAAWVRYGCANP
jgi:hypothetical protein